MLKNAFLSIQTTTDFEQLALQVFKHQAKNNAVYNQFLKHLNISISSVKNLEDIPFLPIQFFKSHKVISSTQKEQQTFTSSGTTGSVISKHFVTDISLYKDSYLSGFTHFYGAIEEYAVLALLPSYLERNGSSLIYMVDDLIKKSNNTESGFFLNNLDELAQKLIKLTKKGQKTLLIGVSFALLDLIETYKFQLKNTIVMETGGMKGRRKELIRKELHELLKKGFGLKNIHSEYGMTELLSQAYSNGNGLFNTPPWVKIVIRDTEDPLQLLANNHTGGVNIIDLANVNSCSFIATQDLGKLHNDHTFEILGTFDNSDIRGCNLLVY